MIRENDNSEAKSDVKNWNNYFPGNLIKILESILNELDVISSVSEKQFTEIGGNLKLFHSQAKEITETGSRIILLLSGEEYNRNTEQLKNIFDNIFESLNFSRQKFEDSETFFHEVVNAIKNMSEDVLGFKRIVKYLRIQGISTKIESSRLGSDDKGFKNLAESVDNLSVVISDKSNKFRNETESLINLIKDVQYKDIKLKREQQEYSKAILNSTKSSLNLLMEKHRQSSSRYEIIYANFQEIQQNIGQMVTSVQFHDITRQQIQHVYKTIENLITKIEAEFNSELSEPEHLFNIIYNISKLQSAQLNHSRDELLNAAKEIVYNLTGISENILYITESISELLADNSNNNQSFIGSIRQGLNNVSESINNNHNLGLSFSGSISQVINTVESLAGFINEIGEIGSEIELVSLNANIKAVHIGNEGAALAVIAEEIQKLSLDAGKQTDTIIRKIISINEFAKNFNDSINNNAKAESGKAIEEFNLILDSLDSLIIDATSKIITIQKSAEKLQKNLTGTIKGITVHLDAETIINRILKELEGIMEQCKSNAGTKFIDNAELNNLSKNYTMQSQRQIHNMVTSLLNDSVPNPNEEIENYGDNNSGEFGDNVELF